MLQDIERRPTERKAKRKKKEREEEEENEITTDLDGTK